MNRDLGLGLGTAGYGTHLATWLASRGHAVTFFASRLHGAIPAGVEVVRLPAVEGGVAGSVRLAQCVRSLPFGRFEVTHALDRVPGCDVYRAGGGAHGAWLAQRGGWVRALRPRERVALRLEAEAAGTARIVVANSVMAAHDLRRHLAIPRDRIRVVRNGVDADRFAPSRRWWSEFRRAWGVQPDGRVVSFIGHDFERKGLGVAFSAFEAVCGAPDRFVVCGGARRASRWRRRLCDPRVVWCGATAHPERVLAATDALCVPTLYDAAANTTLEALATGVPVVTSQFDGSAEVVPEPDWIVRDPRAVQEVVYSLRRALSAVESQRRSCVEVGRRWPVSRNGVVMEQIYKELADDR
ncbi:MAG: UDP-glucose:(heptosyl)LPS alpha-1,3-glucosyltransferase [Myxococcota bacterium]